MTADKIVVLVLTLIAFASLVWLEMKSRRNAESVPPIEPLPDKRPELPPRRDKKKRS